MSATDVLVWIA